MKMPLTIFVAEFVTRADLGELIGVGGMLRPLAPLGRGMLS